MGGFRLENLKIYLNHSYQMNGPGPGPRPKFAPGPGFSKPKKGPFFYLHCSLVDSVVSFVYAIRHNTEHCL